jgi:hypothetical protein
MASKIAIRAVLLTLYGATGVERLMLRRFEFKAELVWAGKLRMRTCVDPGATLKGCSVSPDLRS